MSSPPSPTGRSGGSPARTAGRGIWRRCLRRPPPTSKDKAKAPSARGAIAAAPEAALLMGAGVKTI
jgi:hypothetical protein